MIKELEISPSSYYAILVMDGDNIGKWLQGEFNPLLKESFHRDLLSLMLDNNPRYREHIEELLSYRHPMSPSLHSEFSRRLSQFALREVRRLVEDGYGRLVYAGGDDVLAMLPLDTVLEVAYDLQRAFKEMISPEKASASAGIVIAHHKYPLSLVLKEARAAERDAKHELGRDAFAVRVITGSGSILKAGGKWEEVKFVMRLLRGMAAEEIPTTLPYKLQKFYIDFLEGAGKGKVVDQLLEEELKRLLERSDVKNDELRKVVMNKYREYIALNWSNSHELFINNMILAAFIKRNSTIYGTASEVTSWAL